MAANASYSSFVHVLCAIVFISRAISSEAKAHFGIFKKPIQEAKIILNWDKRSTTDKVFSGKDITSIYEQMLLSFPDGEEVVLPYNFAKSYVTKNMNLEIRMYGGFHGESSEIYNDRISNEERFLRNMVATNRSLKTVLGDFNLRNDFFGDYAYLRHPDLHDTQPISLFLGKIILSSIYNSLMFIWFLLMTNPPPYWM